MDGKCGLEVKTPGEIKLSGRCLVNLRILDNIPLAALEVNQADRLGSIVLAHDVDSDIDVETGGESNEQRAL